jgi:hypothetical protein
MITFGTYELSSQNGVYAKGWRELHGAERALTVLKTVGTRGIKVLNSVFEGKVLELQGELIFDNSDDLITGVRNFVRKMTKNGQPLTIENSAGTFVYDGVYVTNINELTGLRDYDFQRYIEFRIVFLCPKGFARSTTQTIQTATGITSLPYSGSITIDGDTNPEPIISITLATASTITDVFFTNLTTNQQISITGRTFANGDMLSFNTETKQVLHNAALISFNGVFPDFLTGLNQYQLTAAGSNALVVDQQQYNSEASIYGNNWVAQSFQVTGAQSISQIGLLLKQVVSAVQNLINDFSSDYSGFTKTGSGAANIISGKLRLGACDNCGESQCGSGPNQDVFATQNTGLAAAGDGCRFSVANVQSDNHGDSTMQGEFTDGTDYIRVRATGNQPSYFTLESSSYYGSLSIPLGSNNGTLKIQPSGSQTLVYWNDVLKATINAVTKVNSKMKFTCTGRNGSTPNKVDFDDAYMIRISTANSDISVRIETNSGGAPSGTLVTNGALTIPASEVGTDFSDIIKQFATAPALSGSTTYHVKIKQTGGDINNYFVIKKQNTAVLANGNFETTANGGSSWTQVTGEDMYLKMWGAFPTGFDLTLILSYFASFFNIV